MIFHTHTYEWKQTPLPNHMNVDFVEFTLHRVEKITMNISKPTIITHHI